MYFLIKIYLFTLYQSPKFFMYFFIFVALPEPIRPKRFTADSGCKNLDAQFESIKYLLYQNLSFYFLSSKKFSYVFFKISLDNLSPTGLENNPRTQVVKIWTYNLSQKNIFFDQIFFYLLSYQKFFLFIFFIYLRTIKV